MKSSLGKLGRKLTIHKSDVKDKKDHQSPAHLDELAQASKDMQDMRNCYDSLLSAAAATANSIYELSESLQEMGTCLLEKTTLDADGESGRVISTLGNVQSELQKIADSYRSHVILTITNPSESLLSELRKVEEMKLQCDEKREAYEYMMTHHREKGKLRSGKGESSTAQQLQEAHDEYDSLARLCVFRLKSLKEGQCRSLLTQAARHHVAQLNFFRKGLKVLEAVDPSIRLAAEKHRIDYQLSGLDDGEEGEGETSSCRSTDDGELSFDYRRNKQGSDSVETSTNLMEVDIPYPQAPKLEDAETNFKNQGDSVYSRQPRVSFSAPLYAEKPDPAERTREPQASARKFHSYVLPPPVDTKNSASRTSISAPYSNHAHNSMHLLPVDPEKNEKGFADDNFLPCATFHAQFIAKESNGNNSSGQLPPPLAERFSLPQRDSHSAFDSKKVKRQAYSGPLASKPFSTKPYASTSGPINTSTEIPQLVSGTLSRVPVSQPPSSPNVSRSASPPPLSSPKISELHELPRPPSSFSAKPAASAFFGHSAPLFFKNQELSVTNKSPTTAASAPSPLPPPPLTVPRSFSIPSSNQRAMALHVAKLLESPQIPSKAEEVASPPLTPISLSNMKSLSTVSELASNSGQI